MIILSDTNEIKPLSFRLDSILIEVQRFNLPVGDYRALYADGSMSKVVFERKSLPDLWGTMTKGHKRFMNEVRYAKELGIDLYLIIENSFSEVEDGFERSDFGGSSMVKKLGTLFHKYHLPVIFTAGREDMARFIKLFFVSEGWNKLRESSKGKLVC